jgi:predicted RNase H-like HicB family nuclease
MIPKYHINPFWSEPDGAWVADVPDLQSCSAFGDTPAETLAEIEQAIEPWLAVAREDGLPIPERRYRAPAAAPTEVVEADFKIAVGAA